MSALPSDAACLICEAREKLIRVNVRAFGSTEALDWLCRRHLHHRLELLVEADDGRGAACLSKLRFEHAVSQQRCCICKTTKALAFFRLQGKRALRLTRLPLDEVRRELDGGLWVYCKRHKHLHARLVK